MNAASGVLLFPADKLQVVSLSKSGSIFNLWIQDPSFSNSAGTVNFEGIVLNPGFIGSSGKILSVTFRVKAEGVIPITFSSGSVLANDGKGTNILTDMENARFQIGVAVPKVPGITTPSKIMGVPPAPEISSPTHPDPSKWYAVKGAQFTWAVPKDTTAVRLAFGKNPQTVPTVLYSPPINVKELGDLADGTYYFHAQLRNAQGWGEISHFPFRIDTQQPEPFTIAFTDEKETDNPNPTVIFNTTDALSGIDYYKVKIGEGDFFSLSGTEVAKENLYTLPSQLPGKRTILVQAYDRAGNYETAIEEFVIKEVDTGEVKSELSEKVTIVARPPALFRIGSWVTDFLTVPIQLVALIILTLLLLYVWYKFSRMRNRLKKEVREAEGSLHKEFDLLKEDIWGQIKILEKTRTKRQLTKEEEKIIKQLKKKFDDAEKCIRKEIEDIEKEVR